MPDTESGTKCRCLWGVWGAQAPEHNCWAWEAPGGGLFSVTDRDAQPEPAEGETPKGSWSQ